MTPTTIAYNSLPVAGAARRARQATRSANFRKRSSVSKKVLELMKRREGATLVEIAKATEWQNHSIRGFVSGHEIKKLGLKVESTKNAAGERTYRIVA